MCPATVAYSGHATGNGSGRNGKETEMTIQIQIKNVYGNETVYPVCAHAKFLASMAGTRTLTMDKLRLIKANGYTIEVVANTGLLVGLA